VTAPAPIRCTGRAVDRNGQPYGDECRRTFPPRQVGPVVHVGGQLPAYDRVRDETPAEYRERARAAGWRIGPDSATCDRCSRPSPELVQLCRDIERSIPSPAATGRSTERSTTP
jgi:hypothetical protein